MSPFATPWHTVIHGLGLGRDPAGFDELRANRVLAVSDALARRFDDPFHAFVEELLRVIVARAAGKTVRVRLGERLVGLSDPLVHAQACALLVDVMRKMELPRDQVLGEQVRVALAHLVALPGASVRDRYQAAHLIGALLLAGVEWLDQAELALAGAAAFRLLHSIPSAFHRGRGAAILLTILGIIGAPAKGLAECQLRLLDRAFQRIPDDPPDGIHSGRDYRLFPLLLTLSVLGPHQRYVWLEVARAELSQLAPRSRASQTLFYVAALREIGLLDRYVPDREALLRAAMEPYLADTDGRQADDYLRCAYLVHLARQLGCSEALSPRIARILADSVTVAASDRWRDNPYASGFLVIAYLLSVTRELDLAAVVERVRDHSPIQRARLGLALVDEALRLRKVSQ